MKRGDWACSGALLAMVLAGLMAGAGGCAGGGDVVADVVADGVADVGSDVAADNGGDAAPTHLTTAPGVKNGEVATATIGASGGTLTSADGGLTITIPGGALAGDTVFNVTPVTAPASNAVATYLLQPEGTTFAVPVTLAFHAADAGVAYAGLGFLGIALHEGAGTWRWFLDVAKDPTAKTLSVNVSHFSEYSMLQGYQLQPVATTAEVSLVAEFTVVACADPVQIAMMNGEVPKDVPVDPPLVFECLPLYLEGARADRWAVEGVEGGDATHGTIEANGDFGALFQAPSKKPDPATVSVTTWFHYGYKDLQDMLVGRVTITDDDKYFGSFIVKASGAPLDWTGTGNAQWKASDNPYEYLITGTVKADKTVFTVPGGTCTLLGAERPFSYDAGSIQADPAPPTIFWVIGPIHWGATCCDDKGGNCQTSDQFLTLTWSSGCGAHWAELDAAEFEKGALKGSYTWPSSPCMPAVPGMPSATVEWLFLSYAPQP